MIRRARPDDIPALESLLQEILAVHHDVRPDIFKKRGQKFSKEDLEKLLEEKDQVIFVYEEEGQVLGHLFCSIQEQESTVLEPVKTCFIEDLCVTSAARGRQIGQKLYDVVLAHAEQMGCHNLVLDVWDANRAAKSFYEVQGMQPQKTRMEYRLK